MPPYTSLSPRNPQLLLIIFSASTLPRATSIREPTILDNPRQSSHCLPLIGPSVSFQALTMTFRPALTGMPSTHCTKCGCASSPTPKLHRAHSKQTREIALESSVNRRIIPQVLLLLVPILLSSIHAKCKQGSGAGRGPEQTGRQIIRHRLVGR